MGQELFLTSEIWGLTVVFSTVKFKGNPVNFGQSLSHKSEHSPQSTFHLSAFTFVNTGRLLLKLGHP